MAEEDCLVIGNDPVCLTVGESSSNVKEYLPEVIGKICNEKGVDCYQQDPQPAILWCNLCLDDDITVAVPTNTFEGTGPSLACDECEAGLIWKFTDSTEFDITSLSPKTVGALVIWGHDLVDAEITILADGVPIDLMSHHSNPATTSPDCGHCCGVRGEQKPIAIYWDQCEYANKTRWTARIVSSGVHIIQRIGFYKIMTENVCLWEGGKNPFSATKYEQESKQNACGYLPPMRKARMLEHEIEFYEVTQNWLDTDWKMLRDYWERYPVYYALAYNLHNCHIGLAHNPSTDGSELGDCTQNMTVTFDLNCHSGVK